MKKLRGKNTVGFVITIGNMQNVINKEIQTW